MQHVGARWGTADFRVTLGQALEAITSQTDPARAPQTIVRGAAEVLETRWVALLLLEKESGLLRLAASQGSAQAEFPSTVPWGEGLTGRVAATRQPIRVSDYVAYPDRLTDAPIVGAAMAVPVQRGEGLFGVLAAGSGSAELTFDDSDLSLLSMLAGVAAVVLENARLREREGELRQAKDDFVSIVAHEFKTPLTAIKGFSQLLARRLGAGGDAGTRNALETIDDQATRLARLANDLVTNSRLESGQLPMQKRPADLIATVRSGVQAVQGGAEGHTLCIDTSDEALELDYDPDRLQQAVVNLVSGAVKRSPEGGEVCVTVRRSDQAVIVAVGDQGPGLSEEQRGALFQRFHRADKAVALGEGGGLSLAIARGIVEAHGGRMWVETGIDRGNTFSFSLPLVS